MTMRQCIGLMVCVAAGGVALAVGADPPERKAASPAEIARLDAKMQDISESFLRETTGLIKAYEAIGQYDRATIMLEALRKLRPDNQEVKRKLEELEQRQLDKSEFALDVEPGKGWVAAGMVAKAQPLRVRVRGEYRFTATAKVGGAGVTGGDAPTDMVPSLPLGAMIGAIVPPAGGKPGKPPRPFLVGIEFERDAESDGMLFLKANLPADVKCTGTMTALVSGPIKP